MWHDKLRQPDGIRHGARESKGACDGNDVGTLNQRGPGVDARDDLLLRPQAALAAGLGLVEHVDVDVEQETPALHRLDQVSDRLMPPL